ERARLAEILEATTDFVGITDPAGRVLYVNHAGRRLLGLGEDQDVTGMRISDFHPEYQAELLTTEALPMAERCGVWSGETDFRSFTDGSVIPALQVILTHRGPGGDVEFYSTVARDLRPRIAAEKALHAAEAALRQSQKMEAVGRLAGGIAHDFNNLLTIMLGFSDLLIAKLGVDHPLRTDVLQIREAGHRAAALTRQLLAFSRRQVVEPRVLDPAASVLALEGMLKRLVGEQIALELRLSEHGLVRVDPSQLELVLINLAVNSRDAMPAGGRLTIATRNADLSEADVADLEGALEASPGAFVCISVADTGSGMDEATRSRIFEPFFTTKPPGRGTGLGLSTVYGIVRQSEGFLNVESSPARGTEITIYPPRVAGEEEAIAANGQASETQYA
ncbi:MAG: PAS domain-containing protein, partial [Polyangiaceae bacterium]|nr:PAS domain-containing protein [Polyangiaceae bacterium]